jgi:hypothetical protein
MTTPGRSCALRLSRIAVIAPSSAAGTASDPRTEHDGISFIERQAATEVRPAIRRRDAWNKGQLVGRNAPFKSKEICAIRGRRPMQRRLGELALFNLGIDVDDALEMTEQTEIRSAVAASPGRPVTNRQAPSIGLAPAAPPGHFRSPKRQAEARRMTP